MSDRWRVVMIGTDIRGGIKAVVQMYAAHGLFARWKVEYVPTTAVPSRSSCSLQARCMFTWCVASDGRDGASEDRRWHGAHPSRGA
jgi:hypothetical protein